MKYQTLILLTLLASFTHAQQYGWQVIARPSTLGFLSVDFADTLHGVIGGGSAGFYYTSDGGTTWIPSTGGTFAARAISMYNSLNGWAAGISDPFGRIARTVDGGASWTDKRSVLNEQLFGTATQSADINVSAGYLDYSIDTSLVLRTTNAGNNWQEQRFGADTRLRKVLFIDSLNGWINAYQNFILRTSNGGMTWQQITTPRSFVALSFTNNGLGWAVTGGSFFRTTTGGQTWDLLFTVPSPGDDFYALDLSFVDSLYGWAFGGAFYQGRITEAIYRTTDGGVTWYRESIGLTADLGDLLDGVMLDRAHGWAVAGDGRVLAYKVITGVVEHLTERPTGFVLRSNYPNPFNPTTTIEYEIPVRTHVVLRVFDNLGRGIQTLVNATQDRGVYRVQFEGSQLASGVYTYSLEAGQYKLSKTMLLLK